MLPRIAVVFNGDLSINRQGQLNSAICRIKHLQQIGKFEVDAYCIQEYSVGLLRYIRKEKKPEKQSTAVADGIHINVLYKPTFFSSILLETRLGIQSVLSRLSYRLLAVNFKNYALLSGHSIIGGQIGRVVNKLYGIPYCVTWHGSDIHTLPINDKFLKRQVSGIISNASGNIFVSQSLYDTGLNLFKTIPNPHVFYNAADSSFYKFNDAKRRELRMKWGVYGKKVVAFVGNLEKVKNVQRLPAVFNKIREKAEMIEFWIIGDGSQKHTIKRKMGEAGLQCVFWGNQPPDHMPEFMNCVDVIVLPSKNESFGMVLVEAISCGANAVGSNRGGIPEVIGLDNCFELDDTFEEKISDRIVKMLNEHIIQSVKADFNWNSTAEKEAHLFSEILNR